MNRYFAYAVLSAISAGGLCVRSLDTAFAQATSAGTVGAVVYSDWNGGCSVSRIADVMCLVYREARSAAGKRLGLIAFGEEENSRFLFIDVERSQMASRPSLVAEIDGRRLRNGNVVCRGGDAFCSATMVVNGEFLKRLLSGRELAIVDQSNKNVVLRFPLDGLVAGSVYSDLPR